jgi:hypothetical protein
MLFTCAAANEAPFLAIAPILTTFVISACVALMAEVSGLLFRSHKFNSAYVFLIALFILTLEQSLFLSYCTPVGGALITPFTYLWLFPHRILLAMFVIAQVVLRTSLLIPRDVSIFSDDSVTLAAGVSLVIELILIVINWLF